MRRLVGGPAVVTVVALVLAGCTHLLTGKPISVFADPFRVAGMPATSGTSGLRPDAIAATRTIENADGGREDQLGAQAVSDVEQFWNDAYRKPLEGHFQPATKVYSWDSKDYEGKFCGDETYHLVNAMYCWDDNNIGWDRGKLFPLLRKTFGDMAIPLVIGHEYGHAIQRRAQLAGPATPTLVAEQQADCFAGVYMRWVAEGKSQRFTLSTGEGLNSVLAAMISLRDPVQTSNESEPGLEGHGSAFERMSAFQFGFTDGASACAAIDADEVKHRRGDLPVTLQSASSGELPITKDSVQTIVDALSVVFTPADPPKLTFDTSAGCPDARPSKAASYCPGTNTIAVNLTELQDLGKANDENGGFGLPFGDNTAYSILVSRYMLSIEKKRNVSLDSAAAALRTACLTGVATTKLSQKVDVNGHEIQLAAGDLDEAVSGMLTNSLAASDVNGDTVPSGFSRVDAFRTGVLGDEDRCFKRYP